MLKALDPKSSVAAMSPWVRIPPLPIEVVDLKRLTKARIEINWRLISRVDAGFYCRLRAIRAIILSQNGPTLLPQTYL
jgi:hypothetical protein